MIELEEWVIRDVNYEWTDKALYHVPCNWMATYSHIKDWKRPTTIYYCPICKKQVPPEMVFACELVGATFS
jgi:hypothetical protein